MEESMKSKLERVRFEKIRHVSIFINSIVFCSMHDHSALEMAIVLRGRGKIRRKHGTVTVKPGDIILYNFHEPHEIAAEGTEPISTLCIQISNRFCRDYFLRLPNLVFETEKLSALPAQQLQGLHDLLFDVAKDYFTEEPDFPLLCVSKISMLLVQLMRSLPNQEVSDAEFSARQSRSARMRRIVSYIDQHYREKITLADLAKQEGVTPTHMSHFFSDAFRVTFREYLNAVRMEKALMLMRDPDMYLVDICMESGFSDSRYLNAVFEKAFGCNASEYRQKYILDGSPAAPADRRMPYTSFRYTHEECLQIVTEHIQKGGFRYE